MSSRLISSFKIEDHGIRKLRIGDLNNDGYAEFVLIQAYPMNREICAVTALDQKGNVLWQHGELLEHCNWCYSSFPAQVVDWDGDGWNEVIYVRQAYYKSAHMWCYSKGDYVDKMNPTKKELRMDPDLATEQAFEYEGDAHLVVLNGATGEVKQEIPIPAPADDCIAICNFDGTGKPNLLAKDRYWNMWAIANDGTVLWHVSKEGLKADLGHWPAVGDIDGDGLDEVFITNTLIDSDGTILWQIPGVCGHHDGAYILDDLPERRIVTIADKLRMITPDGKVLWEKDGGHLQVLNVGRFSTDPKYGPRQFLVQDHVPGAANYHDGIDLTNKGVACGQRATIYDWYGNKIWSEETSDRPGFGVMDWNGEHDSILRQTGSGIIEIMDIHGCVIETISFTAPEGGLCGGWVYWYPADILGDSRDELILFNDSTMNIHMNTTLHNTRRHCNSN